MEASLLKIPEGKKATEKKIEEARAALLLGLSAEELRKISSEFGIGQVKQDGTLEQMVFTYEELRKICLLAISQK